MTDKAVQYYLDKDKMIEFNIKSYIVLRLTSEHNFVLVEIYNHQTGTNTTFFHNKSELRDLADFIYKYLEND